jgi:peptidoglycan/xylan/chitin deacetylase (PgdA/CDA1 family)
MRLDRFITLNLVHPLRQAFIAPKRSDGGSTPDRFLPILMYHSISDDPETGVRPYYRVCTSPRRFREQMQWLKDGGYQAVGLSTALHRMREKAASNGHKLVALTFDDGFLDFYTNATPILREFRFQATMFLPTGLIGGANGFKNRDCMNWKQVEELHELGCEFGSHTINHPELVRLSWDEIATELGGAKTEIENRLGAPVKAFAYPYAFPQAKRGFVDQFKNLLMAGGYESCVTTQIGRYWLGDDLLQIKRLPVNSVDDSALFQAKLIGAYDWLADLQGLSKALRRLRGAA